MAEQVLEKSAKLTDCDHKKDVENKTDNKSDVEMEESENTEEYIVERVNDKDVDIEGYASFHVKWEGYGKYDSTWEPVQNLVGCDWALRNYELQRAGWLANKYGDQAAFNFLRRYGRYKFLKSHIASNAPIGKKQNFKFHKEKSQLKLFPRSAMCGVSTKPKKEWRVIDILGMTEVDNEKYFLLSLEDYDKRAFIRASLANRLFPNKVIDFYMRNFKWKHKQSVITID